MRNTNVNITELLCTKLSQLLYSSNLYELNFPKMVYSGFTLTVIHIIQKGKIRLPHSKNCRNSEIHVSDWITTYYVLAYWLHLLQRNKKFEYNEVCDKQKEGRINRQNTNTASIFWFSYFMVCYFYHTLNHSI